MTPVMRRIPNSTAYAFIHPCGRCGAPGTIGEGVCLLKGKPGTWWCGPCAREAGKLNTTRAA